MELQTFSLSNVCRVCLKTTPDLTTMSINHVNLFKSLVNELAYEASSMEVCVICRWLLQKFNKFKLQCWSANNILSQAYEITKSEDFAPKLLVDHNFQQTQTEKSQYLPRRNKRHSKRDPQLTVIYTNVTNDCRDNEYDNYDIFDDRINDAKKPYTNDISDGQKDEENAVELFDKTNDAELNDDCADDVKYEETIDCDDHFSEDEIPLVKLRQKGEGIKRKYKEQVEIEYSTTNTEPKLDQVENIAQKSKRKSKKRPKFKTTSYTELTENNVEGEMQSKTLREGFSKRMVQETSEYVVIRRTTEQVLEEMRERAKSDSYINAPYKCSRCVKGFNFQDVLNTHMEKHHQKNGPYQCDMCCQYCPSAVSLRGHIKSHTTRYQCKVCGCVKASRQHLLEHHAAHLGAAPQYRCEACPFTTDKRTVMQRHARSHAACAPLACHACGKLCRTVASLRLHIARHSARPRHACPECPRAFLYYSLLRRHAYRAHRSRDLYCVECDVRFTSPDSLRAHLKKAKRHRDPDDTKTSQTQSDSRAACHHCGSTFARKSSLTAHLRTHTADTVFTHKHADRHKEEEMHQFENKSEVYQAFDYQLTLATPAQATLSGPRWSMPVLEWK